MVSSNTLWLMPTLVLLALILRVAGQRHDAGHWKIAAFDGCRDAVRGGLLFALAGPPLGLLLALFPSLLGALLDKGSSLPVLGALIMLPVLGLVFGVVPALACGALAGALKPWLPRWPGTLLCALLGAALASLWFAAMDFSHNLGALWAPMASGGIGGGVVGAWYLRHNG